MNDFDPGLSFPLGATPRDGGVNFSVFSKRATSVELLLFDSPGASRPSRTFALDPRKNKTFHYWHCFVPNMSEGQIYAWRVDGPWEPEQGLHFDREKVLLDPYARSVAFDDHYSRSAAILPGENLSESMKGVVVDPSHYDWEDEKPLQHPFSQTVIYEMHVAGFTRHPNSGLPPELRGTYRGVIEKIPYLVDLGVTAVELLPVFQFDPADAPPGLENYWGYSPISFFAPHRAYSSDKSPLGPINEFRDMVKALHAAGIEVLLDVVYNHTAEGDRRGPTISLKGFGSRTYYIFEEDGRFANYSGCGNTLNANISVVRRLVLDSLRFWVEEMHVDGFRFDLASILSRDESGEPMATPPLIWDIDTDPVLAGTKLIAEAWDAAGLYQVGRFFGDHWKEWNGKFRDDVRSFFRGDEGQVNRMAARLMGSPDIYGHSAREPERSVNFVTSHDGFTLNDLVSYDRKHNEMNLEGNRDGDDHNLSESYGVEGPTEDPGIQAIRHRQIKNMLTATLLSLGVPMLLMGDEVRRTQKGNNNAYCQDNEISWFDWSRVDEHAGLRRFVQQLIKLRRSLNMFQDNRGVSLHDLLLTASITWHGVNLYEPDWSHHSHSLAFELHGPSGIFYLVFNAYWESLEFELPPIDEELAWRRLIDTSLDSPDDVNLFDDAKEIDTTRYDVEARSVAIFSAAIHPVDK